jgi:hypothetical protein
MRRVVRAGVPGSVCHSLRHEHAVMTREIHCGYRAPSIHLADLDDVRFDPPTRNFRVQRRGTPYPTNEPIRPLSAPTCRLSQSTTCAKVPASDNASASEARFEPCTDAQYASRLPSTLVRVSNRPRMFTRAASVVVLSTGVRLSASNPISC